MNARKSLSRLFLGAALALCTTACNDVLGGCNDLIGPKDYDLHYDRVQIFRQADAVIISFERLTNSGTEIPAKIVANFPIDVGKEKDITNDGSISRTTANNVQFPDVERAVITFSELGEVGGDASGKFVVAFVSGSSLSGEFCGTVKDLSSGF